MGEKVLIAHDPGCNVAIVVEQLMRYGFEPRHACGGEDLLDVVVEVGDAAEILVADESIDPERGAHLRFQVALLVEALEVAERGSAPPRLPLL